MSRDEVDSSLEPCVVLSKSPGLGYNLRTPLLGL